jgi:hypothetical protein
MNVVSLPTTAFAPVVLGFFGLGTGYLIYGVQELFGWPRKDAPVDRASGIWGIWMPGFCQLVTGVYLFAALTLFGTIKAAPIYMAAVAFSAYGIHWFAIGWIRYQNSDPRPMFMVSIAYLVLSVLGATVFFDSDTWTVGVLFTGLVLVYLCEFFAFLPVPGATAPAEGGHPVAPINAKAFRALGLVRLVTAAWLMYLTFPTTLNITIHTTLPSG